MSRDRGFMTRFLERIRGLSMPPFHLMADDIVVFVVGPSGSGKSLFVNHVTRNNFVDVGTTLQPRTADVRAVRCELTEQEKEDLGIARQKNIVFVDTPSFNTGQNDYVAEGEMRRWLERTRSRSTLVGIIYMHRIETDPRYEPIQRHLDSFAHTLPPEFVPPKRLLAVLSHEGVISEDTIQRRRMSFEAQLDELRPSWGARGKLRWATSTSILPGLFRLGDTETAWKAVVELLKHMSDRA